MRREARLRRATDDLAALLDTRDEPTTFHTGRVSAVADDTVSYVDARGNTIADVSCVGALPEVDDVVAVIQRTPLRLVLGPVASA